MKKNISALLTFLLLLSFSRVTAQERISLRFTPKEKINYEMTSEILQDINMPSLGEMGKTKNTIGYTYNLEIGEKDANNNVAMIITYKRIKFITKGAMASINYDSDEETDTTNVGAEMFSKMFGEMIGKKVYVRLNEQGAVTDVKGMDEILQGIIKNSGLADMPGGSAALQGLKKQFTNEEIKKSFDESFKVLPKEKVAIGDTWTMNIGKNIMNFDLATINNYTLKKITDGVATIELTSEIKMNKKAEGLEMAGTQSGVMQLDIKSGLATSKTVNQVMNGNITTGDTVMPIEIKTTTVTKSVKK